MLIAVATLTTVRAAWAADFPTRPISVIIPYAPGGTSELLFRLISARINELRGANFVLESKPGAGGNLGADIVAKAGSGQLFQALLGGEVHRGVSSNVVEEMASGQIKALAMLSGSPNPCLPGVPPLSAVIPNYKGTAVWFGLLAPAGTPREIVDLLAGYVNEAARSRQITTCPSASCLAGTSPRRA